VHKAFRRAMTVATPLRRWGHKIARAYSIVCAREDARRIQLIIPAGAWVCQHCPHVTFDAVRLRAHYICEHASPAFG
jgi:hypothetical protein